MELKDLNVGSVYTLMEVSPNPAPLMMQVTLVSKTLQIIGERKEAYLKAVFRCPAEEECLDVFITIRIGKDNPDFERPFVMLPEPGSGGKLLRSKQYAKYKYLFGSPTIANIYTGESMARKFIICGADPLRAMVDYKNIMFKMLDQREKEIELMREDYENFKSNVKSTLDSFNSRVDGTLKKEDVKKRMFLATVTQIFRARLTRNPFIP